MDELAKRRAEKLGDSREWTAADALEDLLTALRAGKVKIDQLGIHWFENQPDGGYTHHYCAAGVTYQQHIALLHIALDRVARDWVR